MTVKYRRLRIVKHRKGQIHDEDVARWRLEVPEQAAVALAQQVGYGQAVLPPTAHPPLLSPQPAHNALDYANLLPPDVRHAVFRHCEMMARHQRLLLEGQERLKYVQAQIREMKARLPPPPPRPVAGMNRTAKGPDVPPHQVRSPSCWASCCGLAPLPPPPLPPTEAGGPGGGVGPGGGPLAPVALELPPPDYFAQAALATALAQSRRQTLEAQAEQEDYQHALSAGGASLASSGGGVRPFTSSGGGGAVLTTAATGPGGRRDTTGHDPPDTGVAAGDLPGQMDRRRGSSAGGGGGGDPAVADGVAGGPLGGGRPAMAPLQGRAPGTPQSLLRPLASYGAPGAAAAPGAGGGSAPRKVLLPAMRASQAGAAAAAAAGGPGGSGTAAAAATASSYDLSRYQDPESLRKITAIQAAQRGRVARKQVAEMRAPTAAAEPQSRAAPPPALSYDLSRYQDPATLKKITTIQAAQRGRSARKQVAGMRSQQQQQQPVAAAGPGPSAHPFDLPPLSQSRAMAPLPPGLPGRARLAAPPVDVTPQPLKEAQEAAARLAAAQAAAAAADDEMALLEASLAAGVVEVAAPGPGRGPSPAAAAAGAPRQQAPRDHDLSRYQDPESLRKITAIQAAQRGRVARKQVAGMRSATPPPPPPPPAAAPQSCAAPPPASSYDLSRYQDPATLKKITTIQAAQRGRAARKQVAGMKGAK